jgi:hypothetical protein
MSRRPIKVFGVSLVVVAAAVVALVAVHRGVVEGEAIAARRRLVALGPTVLVKRVLPGGGVRHLELPG